MEKHENFYIVYDKITCTFGHGISAPSDNVAARTILSTLEVPIKDTILFCFGSFSADYDLNNLEIGFENVDVKILSRMRPIPWTVYKFPESVADSLAPLGLSPDEVKDIANKKIDEIGDNDRTPVQSLVDSYKNGDVKNE